MDRLRDSFGDLGAGRLVGTVDSGGVMARTMGHPYLGNQDIAVRRLPVQADFTQPLPLPTLDGLVLANALHFVRPLSRVLTQLAQHLRPGGRLLVVEYDLALPRPWVPFPISADAFPALVAAAGLVTPRIVGTRRSPRSGSVLYAGLALRCP